MRVTASPESPPATGVRRKVRKMALEPKPKTIDVDPGGDVARILEEAEEKPVTLRLGGGQLATTSLTHACT